MSCEACKRSSPDALRKAPCRFCRTEEGGTVRPDQDLIQSAVEAARRGLHDDWEWRLNVMTDVVVALADDLAEARALLEKCRRFLPAGEHGVQVDAFLERTK